MLTYCRSPDLGLHILVLTNLSITRFGGIEGKGGGLAVDGKNKEEKKKKGLLQHYGSHTDLYCRIPSFRVGCEDLGSGKRKGFPTQG